MKSNRSFAQLFGATMVLSGGGFSFVAQAQNMPAPQIAAAPTVQRVIPLKNVSPIFMAWWLDPSHNKEPVQLTGSNLLSRKVVTGQKSPIGPTAEKDVFALPSGVEQVNPIDSQNAVLVLGTEAGIAELQKTIAFLDKPMRQVEVETKFVQIDAQNAKALGIDFGASKPGQPGLGFVRGNFQAALTQLVAQNKAKIVSESRLLAINNLAANTLSSTSRPVVLGFKDGAGKFRELPASTPSKGKSSWYLGNSFGFVVTPTINNDDTVTLLMAPSSVLQLSSNAGDQKIDLQNVGGLETIANVRDGDTVALGGLNSRFFANPEDGDRTPASNVVMLVTARIVRRADEAKAETVALTR